ncbi:MAG TPA: rod-binding protein [Bryobacteraceae bacterium]|nr:rod-binding protein [Bryobacteraceae bacterium]
MSSAAIGLQPAPAPLGSPRGPDTPAKIKDAAAQFESMLIGQMLRSVRESCTEDESSSGASNSTYMEVAEQQFAQALSAQGGMGIAKMVVAQLGDQHADR